MSWKDLVALGEEQPEDQLLERQKQMAINQCATLVYTSGTTGMPKGTVCFTDLGKLNLVMVI
jgi:long-chain-fatty-acid--CoA ligase ACSBG